MLLAVLNCTCAGRWSRAGQAGVFTELLLLLSHQASATTVAGRGTRDPQHVQMRLPELYIYTVTVDFYCCSYNL